MLLAGHISMLWGGHELATLVVHARSRAAVTCNQAKHPGKAVTRLLVLEAAAGWCLVTCA